MNKFYSSLNCHKLLNNKIYLRFLVSNVDFSFFKKDLIGLICRRVCATFNASRIPLRKVSSERAVFRCCSFCLFCHVSTSGSKRCKTGWIPPRVLVYVTYLLHALPPFLSQSPFFFTFFRNSLASFYTL